MKLFILISLITLGSSIPVFATTEGAYILSGTGYANAIDGDEVIPLKIWIKDSNGTIELKIKNLQDFVNGKETFEDADTLTMKSISTQRSVKLVQLLFKVSAKEHLILTGKISGTKRKKFIGKMISIEKNLGKSNTQIGGQFIIILD